MSTPAPGLVKLSADDFPEKDRFEAFREIYGKSLIKVQMEPLSEGPFRFDTRLHTLSNLKLAYGEVSPVRSDAACKVKPRSIRRSRSFLPTARSTSVAPFRPPFFAPARAMRLLLGPSRYPSFRRRLFAPHRTVPGTRLPSRARHPKD